MAESTTGQAAKASTVGAAARAEARAAAAAAAAAAGSAAASGASKDNTQAQMVLKQFEQLLQPLEERLSQLGAKQLAELRTSVSSSP